ncbi:MAG: DUF416 family protein [Thiolinea sp.]
MEKEFDEVELQQALSSLTLWKQQLFLLLVCQRLLSGFYAFADETGCQGKKELSDLIEKAWNHLLQGITQSDLAEEQMQAEALAPDTENYRSIYTSSALDAAVAISLLMQSFQDGQTDIIVQGVTLARDSVDMYVQELENMDAAAPDLENKILKHPLMQQELRRQREDLAWIVALNEDVKLSMQLAKDRFLNQHNGLFVEMKK